MSGLFAILSSHRSYKYFCQRGRIAFSIFLLSLAYQSPLLPGNNVLLIARQEQASQYCSNRANKSTPSFFFVLGIKILGDAGVLSATPANRLQLAR